MPTSHGGEVLRKDRCSAAVDRANDLRNGIKRDVDPLSRAEILDFAVQSRGFAHVDHALDLMGDVAQVGHVE